MKLSEAKSQRERKKERKSPYTTVGGTVNARPVISGPGARALLGHVAEPDVRECEARFGRTAEYKEGASRGRRKVGDEASEVVMRQVRLVMEADEGLGKTRNRGRK